LTGGRYFATVRGMTYKEYMKSLVSRSSQGIAFAIASMIACLGVVLWIGGGIWISTGEPVALIFCLAAYLLMFVFLVLTPLTYYSVIWLTEKDDSK
jgi:hypothetical protein